MMRTREQMEATGNKILNQTRTELYLSMRFLGVALNSLNYRLDLSTRTIGTDAAYIRFNPTYLLQLYVERPELVNRTYMHMLMHCIFRHMFHAKEHEDTELWDLCCDIAVESVIDSMNYATILRVNSDFREAWYEKLESELHVLTAEKIYHYFILKKRDPYLEESLRQEFAVCDHSFWERLEDPKENQPQGDDVQMENVDAPGMDSKRQEEEWGNPGSGTGGQSGSASSDSGKNAEEDPAEDATAMGSMDLKEEEWKENAKRIQSDMETYAKELSEDAGNLRWMLEIENRVRRSYKDFLKKFAVVREEVSVDMDSFDYGFYMHGLSLYGNMPLIEENEYREEKRVEELVIAIDTSASCKDKLVQQFLNETGALLGQQESFFHKVQIRIIECDNRIQRDVKITNLEQIKEYTDQFVVSGGYGTDFRPVFAYVDDLRRKGELQNLKGLMYFTDGFGDYPKKATDYETVFVFYGDEERQEKNVPDWAVKLYLSEQETA